MPPVFQVAEDMACENPRPPSARQFTPLLPHKAGCALKVFGVVAVLQQRAATLPSVHSCVTPSVSPVGPAPPEPGTSGQTGNQRCRG